MSGRAVTGGAGPAVVPPGAGMAAAAVRVRERIVRMCSQAEGGHLGGSMSLVEILLTLYREVMRVDPRRPAAPDRDILVLSKGHGAIGLYAVLAECGFLPEERLAEYGRPGAHLLAHPTCAVPGVEAPSGALGHGLPVGAGFALDMALGGGHRRCFVVLGDGELQEGSVWEAAMAASSHRLDRLVAVVDRNGLQITGSTEAVVGLEPLAERWRSFGWTVRQVDGHEPAALAVALGDPPDRGRPTVVIARTVKGKGLPYVENQVRSHYARLRDRQQRQALAALRDAAPGPDR
jgi:transketolase